MQATFAATLVVAANAVTSTVGVQADVEQYNSDYLFDSRAYLGNYNPYDRSYGFPVWYPSYEHSEEEPSEIDAPLI